MNAVVPEGASGIPLTALPGAPYTTVLADPPWRFHEPDRARSPPSTVASADTTRWTGRRSQHSRRGSGESPKAHCYLWVPNALITEGLQVMEAWGFTYKSMLVWAKRRKDGGPDGRGSASTSVTSPSRSSSG